MKVAVLMGSDSDWPILKPAVELLKHFGIEPVVKVASAHRTPSIVRDFVMEADHDKEFDMCVNVDDIVKPWNRLPREVVESPP